MRCRLLISFLMCLCFAAANHAVGERLADAALGNQHLAAAGNVQAMMPDALSGPFASAFLTSYLLIIVSEIGDKTFFIAALLAMRRGAGVVFTGAASALALMTVLSATLGRALPSIVDPFYTHIASVALFIGFGLKLLWEGYNTPATKDGSAELAEVERELSDLKLSEEADALEEGGPRESGAGDVRTIKCGQGKVDLRARMSHALHSGWYTLNKNSLVASVFTAAFTEAFTMTLAAEWGDRSQIATLALGASRNLWGVNAGACMGHMSCTALAVTGGHVLASRISERSVALAGGCTFLLFAIAGYFLEI